ncbi:M20 metallopeptidase family protein, partial [Gorillibacterium massiliense]|uniref:M20 metallopeptidase family protein n=1 Tax=Gorillibacterium massiliense TaxID=1280390 RepID=UPI000593AC04
MTKWEQRIDQLFPRMVEWRRHLHENPELSYKEERTMQFIKSKLTDLDLDIEDHVGGYGLTALLRGGKPGPTVALRADIDALPIQDEKNLPYSSKIPGVMHACGHDGHTTTLLTVAGLLSEIREDLAGNVKF